MTSLISDMHDARAHHGGAEDAPYVVAALYKFVDLTDHQALQPHIQSLCDGHDILGTILLAAEGINGTVCGPEKGMAAFLQWLQDDPRFAGISLKFSFAPEQAFLRMKVRLKREIVTMGCPEIRPAQATGTYVEPAGWDALIDDPDVMVIDTRNRYETAIGSFRGAVDPQTDNFREFPAWAAALADQDETTRPRKLAMFCTGGIRCEKASAIMMAAGFTNVMQLKGGVLGYFEEVGGDHWDGDCFVFDQRVAVNPSLEESEVVVCYACREPLSVAEQSSPDYAVGRSCPYCIDRLNLTPITDEG